MRIGVRSKAKQPLFEFVNKFVVCGALTSTNRSWERCAEDLTGLKQTTEATEVPRYILRLFHKISKEIYMTADFHIIKWLKEFGNMARNLVGERSSNL